ncbi:MAG TPA: TolC family protein [Bacteroidales bacterium]|nr:TolC family protein [Bacteroidales bacterium]
MCLRRVFLLVIFTALLGQQVNAQQADSVYLSLPEVILLAREQSPDAMIARHRFRRSYWEYRSFRAGYLPNVKLEATLPNFNRTIDAITLPDGSETYLERTLSRYAASISINQKIGFTGGELFLQSGLQRLDNFFTDTSTRQFLSTPLSVGFRQPLFGYNAYKWDRQIEPLRYEEARRQYLEANEQVAATSVNYFFDLLSAQLEREIALKNSANYDTLYRIALGRFQLGKIAENELLQLELNLLRARAAQENAQLSYQNKLMSFRSFLRLQGNQPIVLIPPRPEKFFEANPSIALNEALENTSSGQAFSRRMLEAESMLSRAKADGRFDAQLYATFGLSQTSAKFGEVYNNPLDEERLSIGLSIPLLDWGQAKGKIRMAESNLELIRTSISQEKTDFEQNLFIKVMQFNMQKNQLLIAAKSDTVAQKRFDVTQKRYMIGKVNDVLELNNAQIDNDNAKIGYYQALKNYWSSYFELRRLTLYDFEHGRKIAVNTEDVLK